MKKLHSLAFYALLTPSIALGSSTLLAAQGDNGEKDLGEQSMGHDAEPDRQSAEQNKEVTKSRYNTDQATEQNAGSRSGVQSDDYMTSPPANGMAASNVIGSELKTRDNESVGEINDLIIDQDGQVAAVVVNVGGFLGMGDKHVAIDWQAVKVSGNPDEQGLRVEMTREDLQSAPGYDSP